MLFFDLLWREISQPITMLRNEVKSPQIVSFIFPIHQRKVCFCRFLSHGYKCTHTLIFRRKHSLQWYYVVCIGKNVQAEITFYSFFCHFFQSLKVRFRASVVVQEEIIFLLVRPHRKLWLVKMQNLRLLCRYTQIMYTSQNVF